MEEQDQQERRGGDVEELGRADLGVRVDVELLDGAAAQGHVIESVVAHRGADPGPLRGVRHRLDAGCRKSRPEQEALHQIGFHLQRKDLELLERLHERVAPVAPERLGERVRLDDGRHVGEEDAARAQHAGDGMVDRLRLLLAGGMGTVLLSYALLVPAAAVPQGEVVLHRLQCGDMAAHAINENVTKDGRTITCEWHNTPLFDANEGADLVSGGDALVR